MTTRRRSDFKIAQIVDEYKEGSLNLGQANNLLSSELCCPSDITLCFLRAMRRTTFNTFSMNRRNAKWRN